MNLDQIRARQTAYQKWIGTGFDTELLRHAVAAAADVPTLLAEIDRLDTALGACRTALKHHLDVCTDAVARSVSSSPGDGLTDGGERES